MRATVVEVISIDISYCGIRTGDGTLFSWGSSYAERLAQLDFINPPTGIELRNVLSKLNEGALNMQDRYQVVRWKVTDWNA